MDTNFGKVNGLIGLNGLIELNGLNAERSYFLQHALQVEWLCEHVDFSVRLSWPLLLWPIPIQLDSVSIGIAQINGFAHSVVRGSFQLDAGGEDPPDRIRQQGSCRIKNCQMIEAG